MASPAWLCKVGARRIIWGARVGPCEMTEGSPPCAANTAGIVRNSSAGAKDAPISWAWRAAGSAPSSGAARLIGAWSIVACARILRARRSWRWIAHWRAQSATAPLSAAPRWEQMPGWMRSWCKGAEDGSPWGGHRTVFLLSTKRISPTIRPNRGAMGLWASLTASPLTTLRILTCSQQ